MTQIPILLAEDDENDVLILQRAFQKAKIENPLIIARNGEEVVEYFKSRNMHRDETILLPGLLLLDLKMPGLGGFDTLQWIRQQPPLARLIVVVMTSSSQRADIQRAYSLHANSFVTKRGSIDETAEMLRSLHNYWFYWNESPDHPGPRPRTTLPLPQLRR